MIAEQAYLELYPEAKLGDYQFSLSYSGRFRGYNANIMRRGKRISFSLSRKWERISDDVQIGLLQSLLCRLLKRRRETLNMELYEIFLKKVHIAIPKTRTEPLLEESFIRMNGRFFSGTMEQPNLMWGRGGLSRWGSYEYGTDTISLNPLLKDAEQDMLDYVMYHEMLHKKHKFSTKNGRSTHHSRAFLQEERKYPGYPEMEARLGRLARTKRARKPFSFF